MSDLSGQEALGRGGEKENWSRSRSRSSGRIRNRSKSRGRSWSRSRGMGKSTSKGQDRKPKMRRLHLRIQGMSTSDLLQKE